MLHKDAKRVDIIYGKFATKYVQKSRYNLW